MDSIETELAETVREACSDIPLVLTAEEEARFKCATCVLRGMEICHVCVKEIDRPKWSRRLRYVSRVHI
jgi:hypothetical protein